MEGFSGEVLWPVAGPTSCQSLDEPDDSDPEEVELEEDLSLDEELSLDDEDERLSVL